MSKLLNSFINQEHIPLKQFKLEVIRILFENDLSSPIDLTDEQIYARLRILKRIEKDVLEDLRDLTEEDLRRINSQINDMSTERAALLFVLGENINE